MKVLVVGAGRMGGLRAQDLAADPRVSEVLVANRSRARAEELAQRWGATVTGWEAVGTASVDAVVVALATASHQEVLDRVLPQGLPVLCEKPIAMGLGQTARLIALAAEHGSELQVGFQRRFDPGMRAVHDRITTGQLGTLYSLRLISHDHEPSTPEFIASSGGIFRDLHVHDLDVVSWLTGSPIATVYASLGVRAHPDYDVRHETPSGPVPDGDVSLLHVTTASGVQASIHGARHDPRGHDVRLEAFGSADSVAAGVTERTPLLSLDHAPPSPERAGATPYTGFVDRFRDAFRAETAAFVDLVEGAPNPCPPETALHSLRAAIAAELSVLRGAPVPVAEIHAQEH